MIIDLTKLLNGFVQEISFNDIIEFDNSYLERTDIRKLSSISVDGSVKRASEDLCSLDMVISGSMILPCSVSLENVDYPINIEINEILDENGENDEEYIKIVDKKIDILPIVWQNIVMEIPLKIVSQKLDRRNISGIGWKLITEDQLEENNKEE